MLKKYVWQSPSELFTLLFASMFYSIWALYGRTEELFTTFAIILGLLCLPYSTWQNKTSTKKTVHGIAFQDNAELKWFLYVYQAGNNSGIYVSEISSWLSY